MVHIAAHTEANEFCPLDSALVLSSGCGYRLDARDIIDVPLQAQMVSLSACREFARRAYGGARHGWFCLGLSPRVPDPSSQVCGMSPMSQLR
jgi:hypothetical protein